MYKGPMDKDNGVGGWQRLNVGGGQRSVMGRKRGQLSLNNNIKKGKKEEISDTYLK